MIPPDQACSVNSVAGRSCHGPSRPNGEIAVTVRCGCDSRMACGDSDGWSASREPADHTTASAASSSSRDGDAAASFGIGDDALLGARRKLNSAPSLTVGDRRAGRRPAPQRMAAGVLDDDDIGAGVGEQLRAVGAGDARRTGRRRHSRRRARLPARRRHAPTGSRAGWSSAPAGRSAVMSTASLPTTSPTSGSVTSAVTLTTAPGTSRCAAAVAGRSRTTTGSSRPSPRPRTMGAAGSASPAAS